MRIRTYAGFIAKFPKDITGVMPPGEELARFIQNAVRDAGFATTDLQACEGWAWEMCTREGDLEIMTIVGLVDDFESDPPRQWLITDDCEIPFVKRIMGKGKALQKTREVLLRRFCETIHNTISGDDRFSHVNWYLSETFDQPGDLGAAKP